MRRFELHRHEDVSGISGTGVVAEGVAFSGNGPVALRWTSEWPTSVVFHDKGVESLEAVHGHNGRTEIVWLDDASGRPVWPRTTPSGHTYRIPTTYAELCSRHDDAGQAYVEMWDSAECPPEPTWEMVGLAHDEVRRLRRELGLPEYE